MSTLWRHVGGRSAAPFILHLGTRYRPFYGRERTPVLIGGPERVWTLWISEKSDDPTSNRTLDRPPFSLNIARFSLPRLVTADIHLWLHHFLAGSNPCTDLDSPWGFQEVEAPRFHYNRHMNVVRLSALRTGTHFCLRWIRPQGQRAGGRIYVTIRNKTRDLLACSAVPQPNALPRFPVPCSKQFTSEKFSSIW